MQRLSEDQKEAAALWWAKLFIRNNNTTTEGEKNPDHSWLLPFYREIHKQLPGMWTDVSLLSSDYGDVSGPLSIAMDETEKYLRSIKSTTTLPPLPTTCKIYMRFDSKDKITVTRDEFTLSNGTKENTHTFSAKEYRNNSIAESVVLNALRKHLDSKPTTSGVSIDARTNLLTKTTSGKRDEEEIVKSNPNNSAIFNGSYQSLASKDEQVDTKPNPNNSAGFNCCTIC